MKTIYLKNFGKVLVSRPAGLESFNAIKPTLDKNEQIQIDFGEVISVTPSWLDEFLTNLAEYVNGKVELLPTKNASVLASLPILGSARKDAVAEIIQQFLKNNS